jgi:NADH-quinone oxidoreductase subunit J
MLQVYEYSFNPTSQPPLEPSVSNIGSQMLGVNNGGYALPFEVVSMLLLAAMIGCIVIALRTPAVSPSNGGNGKGQLSSDFKPLVTVEETEQIN